MAFAKITAICSHLPGNRVDNASLAAEFGDWTAEKIFDKTGISVRWVCSAEECASDLAFSAAEKLFKQHNFPKEEVDFLLFCTQSPDYPLPTTACLLQSRLGIPQTAGAIDFNLGCSGFVYGLSLAKGLIESNQAKNVLLLVSETYSKFLHPQDKTCRTIFGDGASACLVQSSEDESCLGPFIFGTDGRGEKNLKVAVGGARQRELQKNATEDVDFFGNKSSADRLYMNGPEIFTFTMRNVPLAVEALLNKAQISLDQVDYVICHQANRFMLESLRKRLKVDDSKFCIAMENFGNTVSATIPMAIEASLKEGRIGRGSLLLLAGFGVGYSWSTCLARI